MLIGTNGKVTEYSYLTAVKGLPWARAARMVIVFSNGSPVDAIRNVGKRRAESDFDHVWVVCDVDEFDPDKAEQEARKHNVSVVWSNPCFEVWLILHRAPCTAFLQNAEKACEKIARVLGQPWDKSTFSFSTFESGIADAVKRAKELEAAPGGNPSTDMWRIMEFLGYKA